MKLLELNDKSQLNKFIKSQPHSQFLQSWEWGEFNADLGCQVRRFGIVDDFDNLLAAVTILEKALPLSWKYWYAPRGPVINFQFPIFNFQTIFNFLMSELKNIAVKENIIFLRLEPTADLRLETCDLKLKRSLDVQPSRTLLLDLTLSEEKLLAVMHQKTRYNIRLAEKKGVVVKRAAINEKNLAAWWALIKTTGERDAFRLHNQRYYNLMLRQPNMALWLAEKDGAVLAGAIIAMCGDTATYVHGASSNADRQLMAPYLLHWELIKAAKTAGRQYYDFYGYDESRWPGVSRFKQGFGGAIAWYPGTFDLVINSLYYRMYQCLRWIRRLI